jgi:hypothetical protein
MDWKILPNLITQFICCAASKARFAILAFFGGGGGDKFFLCLSFAQRTEN